MTDTFQERHRPFVEDALARIATPDDMVNSWDLTIAFGPGPNNMPTMFWAFVMTAKGPLVGGDLITFKALAAEAPLTNQGAMDNIVRMCLEDIRRTRSEMTKPDRN